MPELPEVERARRTLSGAMVGARFVDVELRRRDLRRPFAPDFAQRLIGAAVERLTRRGKFLIASLSTGDSLVMHLGMSGSFQVAAAPDPRSAPMRHDHVIFTMSSGHRITYTDPRRFGAMDLLHHEAMPGHQALAAMGPEPLDKAFGGAALAQACKGKRVAIKVALLDQRVLAGVGNIYASEALHLAGISPRRMAGAVATPSGAPRPAADRLAAAIRTVLRLAIARRAATYRRTRFKVYERDGQPCLRVGCGGTIRRLTQAGRSTFYCPRCQR